MADTVSIAIPKNGQVTLEPAKGPDGRQAISIRVGDNPITKFLQPGDILEITGGTGGSVTIDPRVIAPRIQNNTDGTLNVAGSFIAAKSKQGFTVDVNATDLTKMKHSTAKDKDSPTGIKVTFETPDGTLKEDPKTKVKTLSFKNSNDKTVSVSVDPDGPSVAFGNRFTMRGPDTREEAVAAFAQTRATAVGDAARLLNAEAADKKLMGDYTNLTAQVGRITAKKDRIETLNNAFLKAHPAFKADRDKLGIPVEPPLGTATSKVPVLAKDAPAVVPKDPVKPAEPEKKKDDVADKETLTKAVEKFQTDLTKLKKDRAGYFGGGEKNPINKPIEAAEEAAKLMVGKDGKIDQKQVDLFHENLDAAIKSAEDKLKDPDKKLTPAAKDGSIKVRDALKKYKEDINKVRGLQDKKTKDAMGAVDRQRDSFASAVQTGDTATTPEIGLDRAREFLAGLNMADTSGPGGTVVPGRPGGNSRA